MTESTFQPGAWDSPPVAADKAEPADKNVRAPAWSGGRLRGNRADVIRAIGASGLSAAKQAAVLEDLAAVDAKFDLVQVDFHQHGLRAGTNVMWTVMEL